MSKRLRKIIGNVVLNRADYHSRKTLELSFKNNITPLSNIMRVYHFNRCVTLKYIIYPKWVLGQCKHICRFCCYKNECYFNLPVEPQEYNKEDFEELLYQVGLIITLICYITFLMWLLLSSILSEVQSWMIN